MSAKDTFSQFKWLISCFGATLFILSLLPASASAWGGDGHKIVAMIAANHLTPAAEKEINSILEDQLDDLCTAPHTVSDKLVCITTWADGSRKTTHKQTYNWHFVDIALKFDSYVPSRDCEPHNQATKGKCGLVGLDHALKILREEITDPKITRAQALMFVVHIVGDLHQPLHTVLNGGGGNSHPAKYFEFWTDMHKVWDDKIIGTRMMKLGKNDKKYAEALNAELNSEGVSSYQQGDTVEWLNDCHKKAIDDAYGWRFKDGSAQNNGKNFPSLRTKYYEHNVDIVEKQLKRAGARLAKILNEAIG